MLREEDAARHRRLNSRFLITPMIVEAVAAIWLFADAVPHFRPFDPHQLLACAFLFWTQSTFWTAVYTWQHSRSFDRRRLSRWNLMRTIAWTFRSGILIWIMMK
jgi:hypothetical protein